MWKSIDQTVPESAARRISIVSRCPHAAECQGSSDKQPLSAASGFHRAILARVHFNSNTFKQLTPEFGESDSGARHDSGSPFRYASKQTLIRRECLVWLQFFDRINRGNGLARAWDGTDPRRRCGGVKND